MTVLQRILESAREDLARRRAALPERQLVAGVTRTSRGFAASLAAEGLSLVAEFKPASPSRGALRSRDEVEAFARLYEGRAAAMSVLCDRPHFDGGYDLLARAHEACGLPTLCKDFILDPYQVYEAWVAGADAVLLMASALDDPQLRDLHALVRELDLDALVEVRDREELDRALALGASVVGVNSRNLDDLTIDAERMADLAARIPPGPVVVAESGIGARADIDALPQRADAVLVGSAFMTATDPGAKLEELGW